MIEILEAFEQELRPRPGGVAPVKEAVVEAEHGYEVLDAGGRSEQRLLVVNAQVAPQP